MIQWNLLLLMIVGITTTCEAKGLYSKTYLNDGYEICKCIEDNGKIDYCSTHDKEIAVDFAKHPKKYYITGEEIFYKPAPKETYYEKCYHVQSAVGASLSTLNTIVEGTRLIMGLFGVYR